MQEGIGPVLIFGASNFPLAYSTTGGDTISALAAENLAIYKSQPGLLKTNELVSSSNLKAIKAKKLPSRKFSSLPCENKLIDDKLLISPYLKAVAFTGSQKVELLLQSIINKRNIPIPFFARLGRLNPVFILESYLGDTAEETTEMVYNSITLGMGQPCTKPG